MKKLLLNVSLILAFLFTTNLIFAQYQLTNSGFENWEGVSQKQPGFGGATISGEEPTQWNSFVTAQVKNSTYKSAIANKCEPSTDVRPGTKGSKSAKIKATSVSVLGVVIAVANGNLTTGRIYGGSTDPKDASGNYNFSDPASDAAYKHSFYCYLVKVCTKKHIATSSCKCYYSRELSLSRPRSNNLYQYSCKSTTQLLCNF